MDDLDNLPPAPPLPREGESRVVEDADARGIAVVLQGGETWYVAPMPLSPRGLRIGELFDQLEAAEIRLAAGQRAVALVTEALDTATTEEAVAAAEARLQAATTKRNAHEATLKTLHREIAFHALRSHYKVTREEVGALVTQRHWPDIIAALNGRDTEKAKQDQAIDLFERLNRAAGRRDGEGPFGRASANASAGAAVS